MLTALLSMVLACRPPSPAHIDPAPADDSAGPEGDTGDSGGGGETTEGRADGVLEDGRRWTVVLVDGALPWGAVIISPAEVSSDPLPVVLATRGGLSETSHCIGGTPAAVTTRELGVVTLELLGGEQCCGGVCSQGVEDMGGAHRQQAMRDLAAFAEGKLGTAGGESLADVVGQPVVTWEYGVLLSSAVALVGLSAIADTPEAFAGMRRIALYEAPIQPEGFTGYLGILPWDDDPRVDSDKSGCTWDDGANPWYEPGDCMGPACRVEAGRLAWVPDVAASDLAVYPRLDGEGPLAAGMLFLDGDGDGALTLSAEGDPDRDGSGTLDPGEDFPLPGYPEFSSGQDRYWQPHSLLAAALEQGLLSAEAWPDHLVPPEEAAAFWAERDGYGALERITAALPGLQWSVLASTRDHGIPQCSRPHVASLYARLRELEAPVRLGPTPASLEVALGRPPAGYTPLPPGEPLAEEDIRARLPPETTSADMIRTAGIRDLVAGW